MVMAGKSITNFRSSRYTLEQGPQNQRAHQAQGHQSLALSSSYAFAMLTQLQKLERKTQLPAALFFIKPLKAANNVRNHTFTIIIAIFIIVMIDADDQILTRRAHNCHHNHCNFHHGHI